MSSPIPDDIQPLPVEADDQMLDSGQEDEEGEGDVIMPAGGEVMFVLRQEENNGVLISRRDMGGIDPGGHLPHYRPPRLGVTEYRGRR